MEDMEELGEAEVGLSSSFLSPALPDGGPEILAFTSVCLRFLFSRNWSGIEFPFGTMCVFGEWIVGRTGNVVELRS